MCNLEEQRKNIDMTPFLCYNFIANKQSRKDGATVMHFVMALLVIWALLISLLVRLIITKPATRAEKSSLPCQYCQLI